jgi:proton glutamate symport protein
MNSALLKHPLTIVSAVAIGVVIGLCNGAVSALIAFPGQLYLYYLQMTVIPIIITAIASSMGKLMRNKGSSGLIRRLIAVLLVCMVAVAITGIALGIIGRPGAGLDEDTRNLLSKMISSSNADGVSGALEVSLSGGPGEAVDAAKPSLGAFFRELIPSNIFRALTSGSTMAIVFFSIIFGVAIGFLKEESASMLLGFLTAIFEAFQKLISWSLYLLPFGLICLMAGQIARVGPQIFMAMSKFIILYGVGTILIFLIVTVVIWIRSGIANPLKVLSMVFQPVLLAFATQNSMATLPSAITCLKKLKFESTTVNLTLPLGMTLGRFGNIFYFGLAVFFVVQIYGMPLGFIHYAIILLGVIFAGTATAGASGIVTLSVISIVLNPLSLPVEAILVIFMAIDPIIDPFRTLLIVYVNMAATTLIAKRTAGEEQETEEQDQAVEEKEKGISVYIQESKSLAPFLYRENGVLKGLEIDLLNEIGRRINKPILFKGTAAPANIIAGAVVKTDQPPPGFSFSRAWAGFSKEGVRKQLCFLYPAGSPYENEINDVIETLTKEKFLKGR